MAHVQHLHRIIEDMGKYVMFHFENDPPGVYEDAIEPKEPFYLPAGLKSHIRASVHHFRTERYIHAFDHYVKDTNPEDKFRTAMRSSLMEAARELDKPRTMFVRECTLHFIAASLLKQLGLKEAPEIVTEAVYLAATATQHGEYLQLWGVFDPFPLPDDEFPDYGSDCCAV